MCCINCEQFSLSHFAHFLIVQQHVTYNDQFMTMPMPISSLTFISYEAQSIPVCCIKLMQLIKIVVVNSSRVVIMPISGSSILHWLKMHSTSPRNIFFHFTSLSIIEMLCLYVVVIEHWLDTTRSCRNHNRSRSIKLQTRYHWQWNIRKTYSIQKKADHDIPLHQKTRSINGFLRKTRPIQTSPHKKKKFHDRLDGLFYYVRMIHGEGVYGVKSE